MIERSHDLLSSDGRQGMVVPLAGFATKGMIPLINAFEEWFPQSWLSFYHMRPSMPFSGGKVASIPTAIYISSRSGSPCRFSTGVQKWNTEARDFLFPSIRYVPVLVERDRQNLHYYAKFFRPLRESDNDKSP